MIQIMFFGQIVLLVVGLALWSYWPDLRRFFRGKQDSRPVSGKRHSPLELVPGAEEEGMPVAEASAAGYRTMLDVISIYGDNPHMGPGRIVVRGYDSTFLNYLVMDIYEDDPDAPGRKKAVRIDVFR